jgi:hypothetical protein
VAVTTIGADVITIGVGTTVGTAVAVVHAATKRTSVPKSKILLNFLSIKPPNFNNKHLHFNNHPSKNEDGFFDLYHPT